MAYGHLFVRNMRKLNLKKIIIWMTTTIKAKLNKLDGQKNLEKEFLLIQKLMKKFIYIEKFIYFKLNFLKDILYRSTN